MNRLFIFLRLESDLFVIRMICVEVTTDGNGLTLCHWLLREENAQPHSLAQLICLSLRPNKIFKRTLSIYLFHFLLQNAQKVNSTTGMAFIAQVRMQI